MVAAARSTDVASRLITNRRQFLVGAGAATMGLSALGLAGCTPTGGSGTSSTFTFTFWGTGTEKTAVTSVIDAFAKAKKLTASAESIPQNYETKLNTLLAANNPPDAGYLTQGMAMRLGTQGRIVNVVGQKGFDQVIPGALHYYEPGKAVSQTCVEAFGLWYNEDVTQSAGVTPPQTVDTAWSWDDYVAAAEKLTTDSSGRRPSQSGFDAKSVKRYGTLAPSSLLALVALLKSNGVDLFDDAGTKTNIASNEALQVLQDIQDLIFVHRVAPTAAAASQLGGSSALLLGAGKVAMTIDGSWLMPDMHTQTSLKYNVGVLPKYSTPYTTTVSGANGVFTGSKHRSDALELLLQLLDPAKTDLYSAGLWMPALDKYYTTDAGVASWTSGGVHPSGFRTAVIDPTFKNYVNYPAYKIKNFSAIEAAFNGSLPSLFTEKTSLKPKVQALAQQVNALMQGVYPDTAS